MRLKGLAQAIMRSDIRMVVIAAAVYLFIAVIFIDHGESLTEAIAGQGTDPFAFIWFIAWWPYAFAHHINPLWTHLVWEPLGTSLLWVTSVPALAIVMAPLTQWIGPLACYNLLVIAIPVLNSCAGYWLCRALDASFLAALMGGFVYGFSSYVMAEDTAVLNQTLAVAPALLLLTAIWRFQGRWARPQFVLAAIFILTVQFFINPEEDIMMLIFGGVSWCLALSSRPLWRDRLLIFIVDVLLIGAGMFVLILPFLILMAEERHELKIPAFWHFYFVSDVVNFIVPTRNNLIGFIWPFKLPSFQSDEQERGAYLGIPLLWAIVSFARTRPDQRWLLTLFVVLAVASLGPFLWIGGWFSSIAMPWLIFVFLPILDDALPARFALFVSLAATVIFCLWLTSGPRYRYVWGAFVCLTLLPAPHPWMKIPYSNFFRPTRVETVLGPDKQLLVFPFGINGPSTYWQLENHFHFRQTGGYIGYPPKSMQIYPAVSELNYHRATPSLGGDIACFAIATHTDFIVIGPGTAAYIIADVKSLGWPSKIVDDVTVITVPRV